MNNVILIGRLTRDPEVINFEKTIKVKFTLAIDRRGLNKQGIRETDFIPIEIWDKQAEKLCKYVFKGSKIGIEGQIRVERYKAKDGANKIYTKVVANKFSFVENKKVNPTQEYFVSNDIFEKDNYKEENVEEVFPF